nr:MAG TPA: hypothetical protein [Caudoviricetes sp.]
MSTVFIRPAISNKAFLKFSTYSSVNSSLSFVNLELKPRIRFI